MYRALAKLILPSQRIYCDIPLLRNLVCRHTKFHREMPVASMRIMQRKFGVWLSAGCEKCALASVPELWAISFHLEAVVTSTTVLVLLLVKKSGRLGSSNGRKKDNRMDRTSHIVLQQDDYCDELFIMVSTSNPTWTQFTDDGEWKREMIGGMFGKKES